MGIILMHDFKRHTAEALPELIQQLKAGGYKVVHMVPKGSFGRRDYETAQRYDRRRARCSRTTNDCRRADCAGGNCGRVGRRRRRRGFPAGCPCLNSPLHSAFVRGLTWCL